MATTQSVAQKPNYELAWEKEGVQNTGVPSLEFLRGYSFVDLLRFFHTTTWLLADNPFSGTTINLKFSETNKKYISISKSFKKQFESLQAYYKDINYAEASNKLSQSLNALLFFQPSSLTMELSIEKSIIYTMKKNGYTFFMHYFFYDIDVDDDEIILSAFKGSQKLPSYAGTFIEAMNEINAILNLSE